ncbi:cytochrome P450 [Halobacteriales archaeon Cl-PHB]
MSDQTPPTSAESATAARPDAGADGTVAPADAPLPPGPSGLPFLGSTVAALRDPIGFAESALEYGDTVSYRAFGRQFVATAAPAVVERVLVSDNDVFRKGEYEQSFGDLVAPQGVVFTEGDRWKRQRQLLQSSFTPRQIQSYVDEMVDCTAAMVDDWEDDGVVELGDAFSTLTLRILTRTLFDLDMDADRGETVRAAVEALSDYVAGFALQSILPSWVPSRRERRYEAAMADLDVLVDDLVAERRGAGHSASTAAGDDLLSTLAAAGYPDGERMSAEEVRDQLVTFLFAGHETTSTALTFAGWLLAGHDTVQDRLHDEVDSVCGDADPGFGDIPDLEFTEAVAREAMRLYPPVTELFREPRQEMVLGGYRLPEDATLQLSSWAAHRDERWWNEPEAFRPERWLPEIGGEDPDRPEYAYFPFGGGPRHCLGMRFAMTELQLVLATLARRVDLARVTDDLDLSMLALTLDPGDVEVQVHRR